ncbi:MAG: M1 family metallopeptidase [Salinibacter sp.]|uniref:M1 family metallopeptidase n=1 Tax=Salinibacter sp. TaxID=2065818 RepID=UPI0035D4BD6C
MRIRLFLLTVALLATSVAPALAQQRRAVPNPIQPPPRWQAALENGTRTTTGHPGDNYWTNTAHYEIDATLSPETRTLRGTETITYVNRSPDSLRQLVVHLRQNIYKEGSARRTALSTPGGMHLSRVEVEGQPIAERPRSAEVGYDIQNTVMRIDPPSDVAPGDTVRLDFAWSYKLRKKGPSPRQGTDGEVYFLAYWYPQMSVYDDVQGWDTDPFLQHAEFYMDHADYDVELTVPEGWLVGATGTLENPDEVLPSSVQRRLDRARAADSIVTVVGPEERGAGTATRASDDEHLTWHFQAEDVRDVALGTSDQYVWDATAAETGEGTALIHAFYRPDRSAWPQAAEYGRFSIEYLSNHLTPYPYPHMTLVEGFVGGGMEYPMVTILHGEGSSPKGLHSTTLHEIVHQWFPMMVGSEETDHIWMDEGTVTYWTREGRVAYWGKEVEPWAEDSGYFRRAGTARETPPMRHGDLFPSVGALVVASYDKTSRMLRALEGTVGTEAFRDAFRAYAERWTGKHPYPYDLFNTFEDELGRELDWLWRSFLDTTWTLDQAIASVDASDDRVRVAVEDQGRMPMPVLVRATYADGSTATTRISVDRWLEGQREATVTLPGGTVQRIEIDPQQFFPDVDRTDNVWTQ